VNDWVCGNCKSINRASANSCYSCGGAREIVAAPEIRPTSALGGPPSPLATADAMSAAGGAGAASSLDASAFAPSTELPGADTTPSRPASTSDILGGLLAGLVAAVLATAIWYGVVAVSHLQVGIVAIAVGFIVGQGVVLGARRHGSIVLVAISVVLTLLALVVSEYLIVAHFIGQELGVQLDLIQPPDLIVSVVSESVQGDPLTLVFWAIALFQAFVIPSRTLGRGSAA
jgi:hypothetical protein